MTSAIHQYNEKVGPTTLYEVTRLLALLKLKSAQDNPFSGNYQRKIAVMTCFGFHCDQVDADSAAKKLITIINDMAASKWIKASLYNMGRMDIPGSQECMVISYVAIPSEFEDDVKTVYGWVQFPEGGLPPRFK